MSAAKLQELANWRAPIVTPDVGRYTSRTATRRPLRHVCVSASGAAKRFLFVAVNSVGSQSKRRYAFRFMEVIFSFLALALTVSKRSGDVTIAVRSLPDDFEWASSSGSCGVSHIAMPHPRCACGSLVQ
jgi:hypothetical protein